MLNRSSISSYLWMLPFLTFIIGYLSIRIAMPIAEIYTPSLVGKTIHEACAYASEKKLNIRLVNQKEDADLPDGTVIEQNPREGQKTRPYQTIFLVVTKQPHAKNMVPDCVGRSKDEICKELDELRIAKKIFYLSGPYPAGYCIAQSNPSPAHQKMVLYIATGAKKPVLFPNFVGQPAESVVEFLAAHDITPQVCAAPLADQQEHAVVVDQRPLPGSIIADRMPAVQLYVG